MLASLVLAAIFARQDLAHTRSDAVSSLFYYTNWHQIVANHSYFNLMGNPSLLQHIWSLAVEEQFYIVWPLLLVPGLVLVGRKRLPMLVDRRHRRLGCADVAPLQPGRRSVARLLRHRHARLPAADGDPARARLAVRSSGCGARCRCSSCFGVAALVGTVLLFLHMQDFNPTLYRGGDLAAAFCFAVLIAAVAHPGTGIGEALGVAPLRWVGERSYGIYLWHLPIIVLVAGRGRADRPGIVIARGRSSSSRPPRSRIATSSSRSAPGACSSGSPSTRAGFRLEVVGAAAMGLVAAFAVLFVTPTSLNPVSSYVSPPKAKAATHHHEQRPDVAPVSTTHGHMRTKQHALPRAGSSPSATPSCSAVRPS